MSVCCAFTLWGWHRTRFQDVVRPVITLVLAASLIFGMLYPQVRDRGGRRGTLKNSWRGLAAQKNQFWHAVQLRCAFLAARLAGP